MYEQSENIKDLATALCKAQGESDFQSEGKLLKKIFGKKFKSGGNTKKDYYERFFEKVAYGLSDCWYWVGHIDQIGYGRFAYINENKAHRASYRMFKGNIPLSLKVLHKCDVRNCVNPDHLFLGTQKENVQDMYRKGRQRIVPQIGESNGSSKLKESDILKIREIKERENLSDKTIAKMFGVAQMTVNRVVNKKLWRHI